MYRHFQSYIMYASSTVIFLVMTRCHIYMQKAMEMANQNNYFIKWHNSHKMPFQNMGKPSNLLINKGQFPKTSLQALISLPITQFILISS